ncbi:cation diffusion facilitator family transporter [Sporohalobacter salinus]|uniref:cation diffusion facilitator family transporter n=1 Tax=Sporohalobacter salinus TaxID=1494606 RepID=UPI00195FDCAC|nr:cation diffusion facilitator family transporter [Sporohalobacter salinus]
MDSRYKVSQKISIITLISNLILTGVKVVIGFYFHSQALLADGLHSASDVVSTVIVMIGNVIAKEPPDEDHPYGHGKAEAIATKILGISLIIGGFGILKETITLIIANQITVPGTLVLWAALGSIVIKEMMYQYTYRVGKKVNHQALIADAIHHRTDAFSSIAALIGAGGARFGYPILDPIAGLIVALFILKTGIEIFQDAANELMDAAPKQEVFDEIFEIIKSIDDVIGVENLKIRSHGPNYFIDVRVIVDNQLSVIEGHEVAVQVRSEIKQWNNNIQEVLVHIDPEGIKENHIH